MLYNTPTIPRRVFTYKDKNIKENFASFINRTVIRPDKILHIKPPVALKGQINKTSDHVIHLVKEISDINKYKIEQKKYFIYDDSNMIEASFFSELNKRIQIYVLISSFSDDKKIL